MKRLLFLIILFFTFSLASATVSAVVKVIGPPSVLVSITPNYATDNSDLICTWNVTDETQYTTVQRWYKNNNLTNFSEKVPANETLPGDIWTCEVIVTNNYNLTTVQNATVTIQPEISITGLFGINIEPNIFSKIFTKFLSLFSINSWR